MTTLRPLTPNPRSKGVAENGGNDRTGNTSVERARRVYVRIHPCTKTYRKNYLTARRDKLRKEGKCYDCKDKTTGKHVRCDECLRLIRLQRS